MVTSSLKMTEKGEGSTRISLIRLQSSTQSLVPAGTGQEADLEAAHEVDNVDVRDPLLKHHKDSGNRYCNVASGDRDKDHYLRPDDGKLDILRVQLAPGYTRPSSARTTWELPLELSTRQMIGRRLRSAGTNILVWTYTDWLKAEPKRTRGDGSQNLTHPAWRTLYLKYPVACFGLTFTGLFAKMDGKTYPGGKYPSVRYRYFGYSKVARNTKENEEGNPRPVESSVQEEQNQGDTRTGVLDSSSPNNTRSRLSEHKSVLKIGEDQFDGAIGRHLRPRKLCVIPDDDQGPKTGNPYNILDVDEWDRTRHKKESGEYVFVSYTRNQYQTYAKQEIDKWNERDPPKNEQERTIRAAMPELQDCDLHQLYQIGTLTAQNAGVSAFWIDVLCMTVETARFDSHRICDIARGAKCLVIALKDPVRERILRRDSWNVGQLLQDWASCLWTLPEMLLAPTKYDIAIYRSSATTTTVRYWKTVPKRNMAEEAYKEDGLSVRQLVDHFESNLHLTQTELLSIGLECLMKKKFSKHATADPVYALMTLARRRPIPSKGETLFEAFARLSLLNDSNMLLERLICFLPPRRGEPWYKIEDFWGAKLWDIYPTCQIAGIAQGQTVMIDGAFAASIEWGELEPVGFVKRKTIWRLVAQFIVLLTPGWLTLGIAMLATYAKPIEVESGFSIHKQVNPAIAVGVIFFLIAATAFFLLPAAMLIFYRGKIWSTQASLIGIEGVPNLDWLEQKLFGFSEGRLKWSPYSSTQSRHRRKVAGSRLKDELEAIRPSGDPLPVATNDVEHQAYIIGDSMVTNCPVDPDRIFTLVDTYTLTVTTFRAVHPPSVMIICGHEGGMRRALLCSYDYETQTFHRESVLRMSTKVLDKMDRIEKFRFSMESMPLSK